MSNIRAPAVAGTFYPDDPHILQQMVNGFLNHASTKGRAPKAIIAPHAGYIYSGAVAANAYHLLASVRQKIERVVLLGPSHHVPFLGLAICNADYYATPLGDIHLDQAAAQQLLDLPQVSIIDQAHAMEHSLEVQLPFLQMVLDEFSLIPLVVGDASAEQVSEVLDRLWGGDETLIVISSDLSHFHDYPQAKRLDQLTSDAIIGLHPESIQTQDACGGIPIRGLLLQALKRHLHAELLDLRNSGDTAGSRDRVVGYGAYRFDSGASDAA
ncbi:MAG: AmmeMemoRadiSam system protein B [Candidatus Polarisedimenticolaceae bacterium]|nr:AmmeMemoRadiSam system protein B [Candidatus Polarisedimenticolaceae bacterium]